MTSENIKIVDFDKVLGERYLSYALSTITSRSLPDVRDGLKPVHRRLLYAMLQLKLDPKSGYKKCARVVGDVIGKYHPHGDVAVYDTMVRLAQEFAVRYPLVNGQGNFGSIDGDNAAAMRYTEAKLTEVAMAILEDIDYDTVDFKPTYDGSELEPIVMPSNFPNLLANGSEGIAVGMATSIPPHHVGELCDALIYLLKHPNAKTEKLCDFIQGPDFPTGGLLIEPRESIIRSYKTGRGSFRLRAKWEKEELSHGMYQIVITEIPYQVQKSKLIEKIADLFKNKKLPLLGDIRDESTEEIRIVLEPKSRSVDPEMLMESLYKTTELENRINLNMNVLNAQGNPLVMDLAAVLNAFLEHRNEVIIRRSKHRLGNIDHRLEVLAGLLIAYLNLDEVIRIIREEDDPKAVMMKKWKLSDIQVEAILNMRLRSLRKLEEFEIKSENDALNKEKKELLKIINNEESRKEYISNQIKETKRKFATNNKRRTILTQAPEAVVVSIEAFVEKEPITILCSDKGWIKALKGHLDDVSDIKYKDGDKERFVLKAYTTDKLIVYSDNGKFYTISCNNISGGKGHGEPINLLADIEQDSSLVNMFVYDDTQSFLIASNAGRGFIVPARDVIAQTKNGKQILNLALGIKSHICIVATGDLVATIGQNRKLLIFSISEIPVMKRGSGVLLQRFKNGGLSDVKCFTKKEGLSWKIGNKIRNEVNLKPWLGNRAGGGNIPPIGFPTSNKFGL